jgi:spore germination protein (amino acid permease)
MGNHVKESLTLSPYLLWFLLHGAQVGITMLSFQRYFVTGAEQDSWVSLLLVGISMHVITWLMFFVLKNAKAGDIISLHQQLFGKWLGKFLTLCFYGYTLLFVITEIRLYVEVLHVWVFPNTPIWIFSLMILILCIYLVSGGLRVVAGVCFFCIVIPSILLFTLYFPLKDAHWTNFLPLFNHNFYEYAESAYHSLTLFTGVEFLLLLYPFIKNNEKSQKWAHIGMVHTTSLYLFITFVSFSFFNIQQLEHTIWPTLILSKIIQFPFLERFDYIYVYNWFLIIVARCCVPLWAGTRILRKEFGFNARPSLWITCTIVFVCLIPLTGQKIIEKLDSLLSVAGGILLYGYIPFLFLLILIINFIKKRNISKVRGNQ